MHHVRIRMALGGVRLEYAGTRAFFERSITPLIRAIDTSSSNGSPTVDPAGEGPVYAPESPQHFHQFSLQVGDRAATIEQRIMALAFYLWNFEKKEAFLPAEMKAFLRTVRDRPPEDLPMRLGALADEKRFLEPDAEGQAWKLTTKGVNYVKNRLLTSA